MDAKRLSKIIRSLCSEDGLELLKYINKLKEDNMHKTHVYDAVIKALEYGMNGWDSDSNGNIYICDEYDNSIRLLDWYEKYKYGVTMWKEL